MTPEAKARRIIDQKLEAASWVVQDMTQINPGAAPGVVVREYRTDTGADLKKMLIPLAPLLEQASCAESVRTTIFGIEDQDRTIEHALRQAAAQRKNILKAAFAGQLVPQHPNDEPASVLLAGIRAERAANGTGSARRRSRKAREIVCARKPGISTRSRCAWPPAPRQTSPRLPPIACALPMPPAVAC